MACIREDLRNLARRHMAASHAAEKQGDLERALAEAYRAAAVVEMLGEG